MGTSSIINLDDSLLIGKGGVRNVYIHPKNPEKCIKITINQERTRSVRREARYLQKYFIKKKPFEHIPRFYGYCKTNLGVGGIFEVIRNYDGSISTMLSRHIAKEIFPSLSAEQMVTLLNDLYTHLVKYQIIVCDPAPHNLLVQYIEPEKPRLVVVDGIGNPHFIKIAAISRKYGTRIIDNKWRKYIEQNPILNDVFSSTMYLKKSR